MIGNNKNFADFTRNEIVKSKHGGAVIIASSTKNHLQDTALALELNPRFILVEKGYTSTEEIQIAKSCVTNIPVMYLSQYRFSGIFSMLRSYNIGKILKCNYNWEIDRGEISEWFYHILSIDNFLKGKINFMNVEDNGTGILDDVSNYSLTKNENRNLLIDLETKEYVVKIKLGKTNSLEITKRNDFTKILDFQNEDCLFKQLQEIFLFENFELLERL